MDLLREVLERIEFERLIEEGRDPVEVLHYKYQSVPTEVIDDIVEIDPTKKKSYSQWLLSKWDGESDTIVHNLENGRIRELFKYFMEHKDIQIKDCPSVEAALRYVPEEDTVLIKSTAPTTTLMNGHGGWVEKVDSDLANDFEIVFSEDDWLIAVPNTYEADCKLGENTYWCTAGGRSDFEGGRSYYDNYLSEGGQYYVNFDRRESETLEGKEYPYKRYQFHFESSQFMDANDDSVSLDEMDMPDSAIDFYENEGYDRDSFEDTVAKMERYDQQRYQYTFVLREYELLLMPAHDDNYEFEEPDESTSYYVYDYDDDRDPLSWESVPNPLVHNDVILENKENYIKLRTEIEERRGFKTFLLVHYAPEMSGWRKWKAYEAADMLELGRDNLIFILDKYKSYDNSRYVFSLLTNKGRIVYGRLNVDSSYEGMFINEYCTNFDRNKGNRIFIEAISSGYHSLFSVGLEEEKGSPETMVYNLRCVIKRDVPINGEYYAINENEQIRGEFQSYSIYGNNSNPEQVNYHLVRQLDNGDYVVSIDVDDEHNELAERFNIVKENDRRPLLEKWVTEIEDMICGIYVTKAEDWIPNYDNNGKRTGSYREEKYLFFGENGRMIGCPFDEYYILDEHRGVFVGIVSPRSRSDREEYLFTAASGIYAEFDEILTNKPTSTKIVVTTRPKAEGEEETYSVYDYVENKMCYQELGTFIPPRCKSNGNYLFCYSPGGNVINEEGDREIALFDVINGKVILDNIVLKNQPRPFSTMYLLKLSNGKISAFDFEMGEFALPTVVDAVKKTDTYNKLIIYRVNDRYFVYFWDTKQFAINENGTDIKPDLSDYDYIKYRDEGGQTQAEIIFKIAYQSINFYGWVLNVDYDAEWNRYANRSNGYKLDENTPPEVYNLYYRVTGQNPNGGGVQQQEAPVENSAYAFTEQFKRMMKRIDEVNKLRYNDILD